MSDKPPTRNVYILGAGFSRPAGAPLLDGFLDAMRSSFSSGKLNEEEERWFHTALQFRQAMSQFSDNFLLRLDNLEHLFGLLESRVMVGANSDDDRKQFIKAILRTLELHIHTSDSNNCGASRPVSAAALKWMSDTYNTRTGDWLYHAFAMMVANTAAPQPDSVISFNYDLVLDSALIELGFGIEYGLPAEWSDKPVLNPAWKGRSIPLYKLHGSANWVSCGSCKEIFLAPVRLTKHMDPRSLLSASMLMACPQQNCRISGGHAPFIVPPTWNKALYQAKLQEVWIGAIRQLQSARRIFVIGYSLPETDLFFRFLLNVGVLVGQGVQLLLIDPSEQVETRFRSFLNPVFQERQFSWMKIHSSAHAGLSFSTHGLNTIQSIHHIPWWT